MARCLAHPRNPLYDKEYAINQDFSLLIDRGRCPIDLSTFALQESLLPDLRWPGQPDSARLVAENADFIARCFLLQYYRAV